VRVIFELYVLLVWCGWWVVCLGIVCCVLVDDVLFDDKLLGYMCCV